MASVTSINLEDLVLRDRVHGRVYTDAELFAAEMMRIFGEGWVYLGHDSEVPEPGDYVTRHVGTQPVIMARGADGNVRAMFNRCSHRGNLVCINEQGNANSFRCAYHGWTFGSDGRLVGIPFASGYSSVEAKKKELGLAHVARLDTYRGFVFVSLSPNGPGLDRHLGASAAALDRLCDLSPEGKVAIRSGWLKHRTAANWKAVVENQVDGYHPRFVHKSLFQAIGSGPKKDVNYGSKGRTRARYLGDGHSDIDYRPDYRATGRPFGWFGSIPPERLGDYVPKMVEAYGEERARQIVIDGPPHTMIFPNLFIAETNLLVIQPVTVDLTYQLTSPVQFVGAPKVNERVLRQAEGAMGPAGFLIADDGEIAERAHRGLKAAQPEWVDISRGIHRTIRDDEGMLTTEDMTDETAQRGFWEHYRSVMTAPVEEVAVAG